MLPTAVEDDLKDALQDFDHDHVWVLLAHGDNRNPHGLAHEALSAVLEPFLATLDPVQVTRVPDLCERRLGGHFRGGIA